MDLSLLRKLHEIIYSYASHLFGEGLQWALDANIKYPYEGPAFTFKIERDHLLLINNTIKVYEKDLGCVEEIHSCDFLEPKRNQIEAAFLKFRYWENKIHSAYESLQYPDALRMEREIMTGKLLRLAIDMLNPIAESYSLRMVDPDAGQVYWAYPGQQPVLYDRENEYSYQLAAFGLNWHHVWGLKIGDTAPAKLQLKIEEFNDLLDETQKELDEITKSNAVIDRIHTMNALHDGPPRYQGFLVEGKVDSPKADPKPTGSRLELDEGRKQESAVLDPVSNSGPLINNGDAAKWMDQYLMDHSTTSAYLPTIKAVTENARVIEKLLTFARRDRDLSDFAKTYDQMLMDDLGEYWQGWRLYLADHGLWTGEDLNWETRQLILNAILNKVLNERAASHSSLPKIQSPTANSQKSKKKTREPNDTEKIIIHAINETENGLPALDRLCVLLDSNKETKPRWTWKEKAKYPWPGKYVTAWNSRDGRAQRYWRKLIRKYVDDTKKAFIKVTKSPR